MKWGQMHLLIIRILELNFWEDWEKPIFIEVLETDETYYSSPGGVKIFGGWSRGQGQKSLSLFARGQYGNSEFNY